MSLANCVGQEPLRSGLTDDVDRTDRLAEFCAELSRKFEVWFMERHVHHGDRGYLDIGSSVE